jgi:hypothetical protein
MTLPDDVQELLTAHVLSANWRAVATPGFGARLLELSAPIYDDANSDRK